VTVPTLTRRPSGGGRGRPVARTSARPVIPPDRAGRRSRRTHAGAPPLRWRLVTLVVVLGAAFSTIIVRLVEVQGVSADRFARFGRSQRIQVVELPALRGSILDRDGVELALSISRPTVWADPSQVTDPAGSARALSPLLRLDQSELRASLSDAAAFVYLARRVDDGTAAAVRALDLPGVHIMDEPTRVLPAGAVAGAVVGHVGVDHDGLSGIELQYDESLAGTPGEMVVERDPSGRDIPGSVRQSKRPDRGGDLRLTLDRDLQFITEQALAAQIVGAKAKSGVALVMDPRTGEILAMASVVAAKDQPPRPADYNKAVVDVYEPGSVMKLVTLAGALEEGAIRMSDVLSVADRITVAGTTFLDSEPHPVRQWTATDIMAQSSNAGAIAVAQRLGADGLDRYLRNFGLAGRTGLEFPGEATGIVPSLDDWSGTSLPTLAIGYGLAITPLHMLAAYNTVANGGVYVAPSLVAGDVGGAAQRRVVSPETASRVTAMLTEVVRAGTGTTAAVPGYTVAGKTGTARKAGADGRYEEGAYIASFAGFLPAEAPRLSAIVVLDEPQPYYGGLASGPVFSELATYAARRYQVPTRPAANLAPSSATRS